MGRNFGEVLDKAIKITPEQELDLRSDLNELGISARYRAPEQSWDNWRDITMIVARYFGNIKPEDLTNWQRQFCKLITNLEQLSDNDWILLMKERRGEKGEK
jgi:hypothetical protein